MAAAWKNAYNHRRPHSSLGYVPPAVFAAGLDSDSPDGRVSGTDTGTVIAKKMVGGGQHHQ